MMCHFKDKFLLYTRVQKNWGSVPYCGRYSPSNFFGFSPINPNLWENFNFFLHFFYSHHNAHIFSEHPDTCCRDQFRDIYPNVQIWGLKMSRLHFALLQPLPGIFRDRLFPHPQWSFCHVLLALYPHRSVTHTLPHMRIVKKSADFQIHFWRITVAKRCTILTWMFFHKYTYIVNFRATVYGTVTFPTLNMSKIFFSQNQRFFYIKLK